MPKRFAVLVLAYAFSNGVRGQVVADTAFYGSAATIIGTYYVPALGGQSPLYNGAEYIEYAFTFREGYPFFESQEFTNGEIYFDGMIFHKVPLCYDLVKDQVVIRDFNGIYKIVLPANKIEQFTLSGRTFVRIQHDSLNHVKSGFYEQLCKDKIALFAKREKKIIEKNAFPQVDMLVKSINTYYIRKEAVYYNLKNKAGLLNILNSRKKEILQYFKKNKIRFNDDPEKAMIAAVEYYNGLIN
ncbi:MAG TPA: hypothetical protein VKB95_09295 [Chitinophagaceae bacterium]|nr:hypothetical protein [Chitinophagaceae bacterium]